ncbi:hypothetical protein BJV78DRAFT_316289 [Lactifluus subvellereus]|nr:hypothetical protein BJV78DRAFT_316289 [Lactifluus subvellereus]
MTGSETCSQGDTGIPLAHFPLPESLDTTEADIIVQSSDYINFPVHKSILASSSQFFRDMFSLPQPSKAVVNGLPVVHLSEDAELIRALITVLYPIPSEIPASYSRVLALLAAAQKYDMSGIQSSIRAEVSQRKLLASTGTTAFVYAIASKNRLLPEVETVARLTLDYPLTFEFLGNGLRLFEGWALRDLASFRKSCRDSIVLCLESFLDAHNGPSKIWINCPRSKAQHRPGYSGQTYSGQPARNDRALPSWLHGLFTEQIDELKLDFTNPLLKPSSIRNQYLEALQVHIGHSDGCASCLKTHALQGEKYCVHLEQKLVYARDKVQLTFV